MLSGAGRGQHGGRGPRRGKHSALGRITGVTATIRAVRYQGVRTVACGDGPEPRLDEPGDAIVQVELAGVCGSDLHVYHGRETGIDLGTALGHEMIGRIAAAGKGVRGFRVGDRVVAPFTTNCGDCFYCGAGLTARCEKGRLFGWVEGGKGLQGAQAERVRVPMADATLVEVPDDLPGSVALLLADVLPTGYFCALQAGLGGAAAMDAPNVVVVGCGPVGLMAILAASELGAKAIFAIDVVPERLEFAAKLGARTIDASAESPVPTVREATEGRGADAVLEAVGSAQSGALAYELVRPGGTISAVGVHHEPTFAFSPAQAYDKNLTYRVGRCPARALIGTVLPIAQRRWAELLTLVTHVLPLSDGAAAYDMFDRKREGCIKAALAP